MKLKKVVIIGMGLIGGSIGKALIKRKLTDEVVGVCRRQSSLDRAVKAGALTKGYVDNYREAVKGADIIVIATPVSIVKEVLKGLSEVIEDKNVVVTDVGSTKKEIVGWAAEYKDEFTFIGSHPLAGSEKTGVEFSDPDLFGGLMCIVMGDKSATGNDGFDRIKEFWEALGARVGTTTPEKHDYSLAFSSHLPHVVAYALAGTSEKEFPVSMRASGFTDTTRIASSDAVLWGDILLSNRENVLKALEKFREVLSRIEEALKMKNREELVRYLKDYKKVRDEIL